MKPGHVRVRVRSHRARWRRARRATIEADQLAVYGAGGHIVFTAAPGHAEPLDVLLFGGLPIRAPIVHYGPFVMNTRAQIIDAIEDYQAGRLGTIPADQLTPRKFA